MPENNISRGFPRGPRTVTTLVAQLYRPGLKVRAPRLRPYEKTRACG